MKVDVCHIIISDACHERRLNNQLRLMKELGLSGKVFALHYKALPAKDQLLGFDLIRIKILRPEGGKLKFLEFNFKLFFKLFLTRTKVFHVHDLWPLPAVIMAALLKGIPVIYDAHEYYMGLEIFRKKKTEKRIWRWVELFSLPFVDILITVSEPLRNLYVKTYPVLRGKKSLVIRNVPDEKDIQTEAIAGGIDLPEGEPLVVFQGIFKPGRGLIALLEAFKEIQNSRLVLVGFGELEEELRKFVSENGLDKKVIFTGRVRVDQMIPIASRCSIGVVLFEPSSLNYKYALPNKFFEYIHAGIPVIASDIPTFRNIYKKFPFGMLVDPGNPNQIRLAIVKMLNDKPYYIKCQENVRKMQRFFIWKFEKKALARFYKKII